MIGTAGLSTSDNATSRWRPMVFRRSSLSAHEKAADTMQVGHRTEPQGFAAWISASSPRPFRGRILPSFSSRLPLMNRPSSLPARRSSWNLRQKLIRVLWGTVGKTVWSLHPSVRPVILRLFGGKVGQSCRLARTVDIAIPWNVHIGHGVEIGEGVVLYGLGLITIGSGTVIDYRAHICAGTHDMTDPRFPLLTPPIMIGEECFIGADAYVAPGVMIARRTKIWPRASIFRDTKPGEEMRGTPARNINDIDPATDADDLGGATITPGRPHGTPVPQDDPLLAAPPVSPVSPSPESSDAAESPAAEVPLEPPSDASGDNSVEEAA